MSHDDDMLDDLTAASDLVARFNSLKHKLFVGGWNTNYAPVYQGSNVDTDCWHHQARRLDLGCWATAGRMEVRLPQYVHGNHTVMAIG